MGFNYVEGFNFQEREPSAEITEKVPVLEAVPYGFYLFFFFFLEAAWILPLM